MDPAPCLVSPHVLQRVFLELRSETQLRQHQEHHTWISLGIVIAALLVVYWLRNLLPYGRQRPPSALRILRTPTDWVAMAQTPEAFVPYRPPVLSTRAIEDPTIAYLEQHPEIAQKIALKEWEAKTFHK